MGIDYGNVFSAALERIFRQRPVRYGCVLYSLYHLRDILPNDSLQMDYLDLFYKSTRYAVKGKAFADLIFGCFAGCMYALRTRRAFNEILFHAQGFRLSVNGLTRTYVVATEERFLLECMWEKMIWYMLQRIFAEPSPTIDVLKQLAQSSKLLFDTAPNRQQPRWLQESYSELEVKIQFVKLSVSLQLRSVNDFAVIQQSLKKRFLRDFNMSASGTQIIGQHSSRSTINRQNSRRLMTQLWLKLLALMMDLISRGTSPSSGLCYSTIAIILSIHSIIDLITIEQDESRSVDDDTNDLAIYCLTLIGMVMSEVEPNYLLGFLSLLVTVTNRSSSRFNKDSSRQLLVSIKKSIAHPTLFRSSMFTVVSSCENGYKS